MQDIKFIECLSYFLENPYSEVYIRELAKKINISPFAAKKYVDLLIKETLVIDERKANLRYIRANVNNPYYKHAKITQTIRKIVQSQVIENLKKHITNLSAIVLFGSCAKGEDTKESDLDMIIIGKKNNLDLHTFEKKLGKEINIHFFSWHEWNKKAKQDSPFYYEIINSGIPLHGELPLIQCK